MTTRSGLSIVSPARLALPLLLLAVLPAVAHGDLTTPDAKLRKIEPDGRGNCIASTQQLLFGKDDSYTGLQEAFDTRSPMREVRCYMGQRFRDFAQMGAFANQLRDHSQYFLWVGMGPAGQDKASWSESFQYTVDGANFDWDQVRYVLALGPEGGKCSPARGGECIDLDAKVRELAASEGKQLPYTADVCLNLSFGWADRFEEYWDDSVSAWRRREVDVRRFIMASGCFKHTAL